ncbi:MAG: hypothetical protein ACKVS6_00235 [Planctomycetota bacterium]
MNEFPSQLPKTPASLPPLGDILKKSWGGTLRMLPVAIVFATISEIYRYFSLITFLPTSEGSFRDFDALLFPTGWGLRIAFSGFVANGVYQYSTTRRILWKEWLRASVRALPTILASAAAFEWISSIGCPFACLITNQKHEVMLLGVPNIIITLLLFSFFGLAPAAAACDGVSPRDAFRYSLFYSRGNRSHIFIWLLLLFYTTNVLLLIIVIPVSMRTSQSSLLEAAVWVWKIFIVVFALPFFSSVYVQLRRQNDPAGDSEITKVFE